MTAAVLDSYAVIAYLRGEPAADEVQPLIADGHGRLSAVGVAEVIDRLIRLTDVSEDDAVLDLMQLGLYDAAPVDARIGTAAGRLRARYYHRTRCPISMADGIAAEVARSQSLPLATADPALLAVCHDEGIDYLALPGTDGTRWRSQG